MKLFWKDGRFAWPFVVVAVYLATALFLFDLIWRIAKLPIEEFLAGSAAVLAVSSIGLFLAIRLASRGAAPKRGAP